MDINKTIDNISKRFDDPNQGQAFKNTMGLLASTDKEIKAMFGKPKEEPAEESYEDDYEQPCLECNGTAYGRGVFSTGKKLEHYQPSEHELLKNIYIECPDCGWNQAS